METVIRLKLDELDQTLISNKKSLYKNKQIEIINQDHGTKTDYLAANQNNHKFLLRQIAFVKKNKGLKTRI